MFPGMAIEQWRERHTPSVWAADCSCGCRVWGSHCPTVPDACRVTDLLPSPPSAVSLKTCISLRCGFQWPTLHKYFGHAPFPASCTNIFSRHSPICRKFLCGAWFSTTGDDQWELSHHCRILVWPRMHELSVYVWERQLSSFGSWEKYSSVNLI